MATEFRSWLLEQMRVRNLNQSQLARQIGVVPSLVNRYINEGVLPSADTAEKLARAFRTDEDVVRQMVGLEPKDRPAESLRAGEIIGMVKRVNWHDDTKYTTMTGMLRTWLDQDEERRRRLTPAPDHQSQ